MNKKILFFSLLLVSFFVVGCGNNNKLVCYEEINDGDYKQSLIMTYNKEKTQIQKTSIEIIANLRTIDFKAIGCDKETKEECLSDLEEHLNSGCDDMLENCQVTDKNENGFVFTADIKEDKLEEYFGEISTTLPINQMRTKIETLYGFNCE